MNKWWLSQSPRDRQAVMVAAAAVILLMLYLALWIPFKKQIEQKKNLQEGQRSTLNWMRQRAAEVKLLKGSQATAKRSGTNEALLTLVDRTAKQNKLRQFIQRLKPQGSDAVQLWVEGVPFDTLVQWLGLLVKQHGLFLESVNIERQEKSGLVNARLNLQRGPA